MKKFYFVITALLLLSTSIQAQPIDWEKNKKTVQKASEEAAAETNKELSNEGNKYAEAFLEAGKAADSIYADEIVALTQFPQQLQEIYVKTNNAVLLEFLKEFKDGSEYYKINYTPELKTLKAVSLIRSSDLNFLGSVVEIDGGKEIWLNYILLQYPHLLRVIFYRQMGKVYGLPEEKNSKDLDFMSDRWEINPKYEYHAYNLAQFHTQEKKFFIKLQKKHSLDKKL